MVVKFTQETFEVAAIKPVVINPSILEGEHLIPSLYGTQAAIQINKFAPINLTPPTVSGASAIPSVITCFPGVWSASPQPVFTYQWYSNGVLIPGETNATITTDETLDETSLTCSVRAENLVDFVEILSTNSVFVLVVEPINLWQFDLYSFSGLPSKNRIEVPSVSTFVISGTGRSNTDHVLAFDIYAISYPT